MKSTIQNLCNRTQDPSLFGRVVVGIAKILQNPRYGVSGNEASTVPDVDIA